MSVEITLDGVSELIDQLEALGRKGNSVINNALEKGSEPVLDAMKNSDMFDDRTGNLRKSIKVSKVKTRKGQKFVWCGDVDGEARYSWYLEMGSSNQAAKPFMRTAYEETKEKARQIIADELRKGFDII